MTRAFSSGWGLQSVAVTVLQSQGRVSFDVYLFVNVGNDSENPPTLAYGREVLMPFAASHGIVMHEIRREKNGGETLLAHIKREERSIHIPVRMSNGAPGTRWCSENYKARVVRDWLGDGAHVVGIGISLDEWQRARTDSGFKNIVNEYPLLDLRLSRADCMSIVLDAGLPLPPKSACWFCPFHRLSQWRALKHDTPELFTDAVELERLINAKRAALGKDDVYLTAYGRPLDSVIGDGVQLTLDDAGDSCESGYCMV